MERVSLVKVGGVCAIVTGIVSAVGVILIIAGTDLFDAEDTAEALPIFEEDQAIVAIALWLFVLGTVLLMAAGLGLFQALRQAGSLMWVALVAFVGGAFVTLFHHFTDLAVVYELAPAYVDATGDTKSTLAIVGDTLDSFAHIADAVGGVLILGIGVLLFSLAILRTAIAPKWIAWLGFLAALLGGWVTLLGPAAEVFEFISFIGFMVWMIAIGVALWRAPEPASP